MLWITCHTSKYLAWCDDHDSARESNRAHQLENWFWVVHCFDLHLTLPVTLVSWAGNCEPGLTGHRKQHFGCANSAPVGESDLTSPRRTQRHLGVRSLAVDLRLVSSLGRVQIQDFWYWYGAQGVLHPGQCCSRSLQNYVLSSGKWTDTFLHVDQHFQTGIGALIWLGAADWQGTVWTW